MMNRRQYRQSPFAINLRGTHVALSFALALMLAATVATAAQAQTYTVLYTFSGKADGAWPYSGVIFDRAGNLYGTTFQGGDLKKCPTYPGCGVVYKLDPSGRQTVLHTFTSTPDGQAPGYGNLLFDTAGNLYGTTVYGGTGKNGAITNNGVVFKLSTKARESILHNFPDGSGDGAGPEAGLVQNAAGEFYGTTFAGGQYCSDSGCGTVFKMSKTGKYSVMHSFNGYDGFGPVGGLVVDGSGNVYGIASSGGLGYGTVFKISKTGKFSVLYKFKGAPDGYLPFGTLVLDKAGNLYGTTFEGGNASACPAFGCGIVFKLDNKGKETILHTFSGADGAGPFSGLILDATGALYGTTMTASNAAGTIFKLDQAGNFTTLYGFTGKTDGGTPFAGLTADQAGNLYGTTYLGGLAGGCPYGGGCGVVFKLTP